MPGNEFQGEPSPAFATTQWSIVLAAHRGAPDAREALASLCRVYWYPLYAYAKRRAGDEHEAQDLTQAFFSRLLEMNLVAVADPRRGRFRTFLLTTFKNFLANEWDKGQAKKRGGGQSLISLDFLEAESRYPIDSGASPERLFEREWVLGLLDQVLNRLREEFAAAGKAEHFEILKEFISGLPPGGSYQEAGRRLGITDNAAKVAAHRLRQRYRVILRDEVARTVAAPGDVDDEIRSLFALLSE